ncbi:MAG: hypothetical protein M9949_01750 [Candidatus Kapabacteria bacterium]|nr:hypothetical protein [Candidatus Kapabacteria bacterium]
MATALRKDIAGSILQLPIRALTLADGTNTVTLMQLEAESNFLVDPVIRIDDEGNPRTIAYTVKAEIFVPHNKFEEPWLAYVNNMVNKTVSAVISLGSMPNWPLLPAGDKTTIENSLIARAINSSPANTGGAYIDMRNNAHITMKVESPERRQRYLITITTIIRSLFTNEPLNVDAPTGGTDKFLMRRTISA